VCTEPWPCPALLTPSQGFFSVSCDSRPTRLCVKSSGWALFIVGTGEFGPPKPEPADLCVAQSMRYSFNMQVYTVSQLTQYIKDVFEADPVLLDLWVEGEVSNCVQSAAGHMYFTLKDARAQLSCVLWRSIVASLEHLPANGDAVMVHGRASVYEVQGRYQLYVDSLQPVGAGTLFLRLQALKDKLQREGLFAAEHKRALPSFPRKLGVVTSPVGAALRDILHVLQRRYPLAEIILAPTLVQGDEAPPQIVAAIEALNAHTDVDAIIVARGGGSLEELWAFNDERVARAIFASRVPVISGVGHETDYTLADFVADVRAPTPSAAAEVAVPDQEVLRAHVVQYRDVISQQMRQRVAEKRGKTEDTWMLLRRFSPRALVDRWRQSLDERRQRMVTVQRHRLELLREHLAGMGLRLEALSPESTLHRGYAVVSLLDTGAVVTHTAQVASGDGINVRVSDGHFAGTVD
jgi:exodeoxyribonuclease VII large subunit